MSYVYILQCSDHTLYTGYCEDVQQRLQKHNEGIASKYTRSRLPVKLVYLEELKDKSSALKREAAIKNLTRKEKQALIFQTKIRHDNEQV